MADAGSPIGRRVFLGLLGAGAVGVLVGARIDDFLAAHAPKNDPLGLSTLLPLGNHFRYYTVTSVEVTRWINDALGIATFVDAGNAFDEVSDFHLAVGYGIGARVKTPIGPFRLDVAYGEQSREVRLHFSVGVGF